MAVEIIENATPVKTKKDLGQAIKKDSICIEIENEKLVKTVVRIKATGKVAWGVCIGCFAVAIGLYISIPASGGTSAPVATTANLVPMGGATAVLGLGTAVTALEIAIYGGGIAALNKLRKYKIIKKDGKVFLLKKKNVKNNIDTDKQED